MNGEVYFWGGVSLVALFIVAQVTPRPGRTLWWIVKSAVTGCLLIFGFNLVGQYFHYHLPFNAATTATAGVLGLPGLAALVALHLWIFPSA